MTGMVADVRSEAAMRKVVETAVERYGGLDVLVCSAGIQTYGTVEDTSLEDWQAVLDVNLTGMFLAAKYAVPHLRARGGGAIVNISSVQGHTPATRVVGYSVSKAAVDALTRSLAVDHAADGIRANSVAPGPVDTPLLRNAHDPGRSPAPSREPSPGPRPRIAAPDEVAAVVAFLASKSASYVTGACYPVDGGMLTAQTNPLLRDG
ncbi:glucose 1-dehydrogenase [Flindersiella endophytica]